MRQPPTTPTITARPAPIVRTLDTRDFDQMTEAFVHWNHRFEQLGRGSFQGRIRFADFDGVQLFDTEMNVVIRCRGARPPDSFTFSLVEPMNAEALWRGRVLRPGMINVGAPSHEMDHRTSRNYRHTAITIRRDLLERMTPHLLGIDIQALLASEPAVQVEPRLSETLARDYRTVLRALDLSRDSESSWDGGAIDPGELVANLLRTLSAGRITNPCRTTPTERLRVVREAEEYTRSVASGRVTVLQLCRLTGVSERTLHYAFLEVTGLSPKTFLKAVQLNRARREIMRIGPGRGHVAAVAKHHGFLRPGNFASDFRRLFGVLPTQVFGRRSP